MCNIPNYSYDESQVRVFKEGQTSISPLERQLLDRIDDITSELEEVLDYE